MYIHTRLPVSVPLRSSHLSIWVRMFELVRMWHIHTCRFYCLHQKDLSLCYMCLCGSSRTSETTVIVKYHSIMTSMRCVYLISFDREKATDVLQGQHERTLHLTIFPSQPLYYQQELTTITCDRKILLISLNCHRFVEDGRRDEKKQYQSFEWKIEAREFRNLPIDLAFLALAHLSIWLLASCL